MKLKGATTFFQPESTQDLTLVLIVIKIAMTINTSIIICIIIANIESRTYVTSEVFHILYPCH